MQIINKIIIFLADISCVLCPPKISLRLNQLCDKFYSIRCRKLFVNIGRNSLIMRRIYVHGGECISIGDNFYCYWGVRLETYKQHNGVKFSPKIIIGNNVSINPDCHIGAVDRVELHDGVLLASRVFITDHFHGGTTLADLQTPPQQRILNSKGPVVIKKNAWLGEGVSVMPGVTIGENAVIGANSVVTKNIPDNAIAAGVPAKVIKQL